MEEYAAYLRKSRADVELEQRGEYETLARHETELLALSKKLNKPITKIYKEVVSGETIAARPVVQGVLQEVEAGKWAGIYVMEVERLARGETIDQGIVAQAFKYSNTKIITPLKIYDPTDDFDEEYFEFGLFMSRREYKTINRRIQRGRNASAREGKFLGSVAPYGYIKVKIKDDKGYTLEVHPEQVNVIKLIFEWYVNGELQEDGTNKRLGSRLIAKKLDSLNVKPLVNDSWSVASIRDILKNPVYIGKIRWGYRKEIKKVIDGNIIKTRPDNKNEDYILVDGLHPAIVDIDTYNKAQHIMKNRVYAPVKTNATLQNPLSGLVYCQKCGKMMTRLAPNSRNKYSTLKCVTRDCDNVSAPIFLVEEKILSNLKEYLIQFNLESSAASKKKDISITVKEQSLLQIEQEIKTLNTQMSNIHDLLEQGVYSTDMFLERNKIISSKLKELETNYSVVKKEYDEATSLELKKRTIIPHIEMALEAYPLLQNAEDKNELLKSIVQKVEYLKTERNTRGKLNNDNFSVKFYPKIIK